MIKLRSWFWHGIWTFSLILSAGIFSMYAWLPADGATGDMKSFTPQGYLVQWIIEPRPGGLQQNDIILRAGEKSYQDWLEDGEQNPAWLTGESIQYEILRDNKPLNLKIELNPLSFRSILGHWGIQLFAALCYFIIGLFVFLKQPQQRGARLFMLFCVSLALQYVGDAYNFQFASIPWRWPFWIQFWFEFIIFTISLATVCYFTLEFPQKHPLLQRYPILVPGVLYLLPMLLIIATFIFSNDIRLAMMRANNISWWTAIIQIILAINFGIRSVTKAKDPVARAQIRWILFGATIGVALAIPGYILPLILGMPPFFHHPMLMISIGYMIVILGISILGYRLFDIEIVINRTLVYSLLTVILGSIYFAIVSLSTYLINSFLQSENEALVVFIATLSIASIFVPIRARTRIFIDRVFYRSKVDYQKLTNELSERLATSILPDQLAKIFTEELPRRLQIRWASLAILDVEGNFFTPVGNGERSPTPASHQVAKYLHSIKEPILRLQPPKNIPQEVRQYIDNQEIELCVPLILANQLVGLLSLGGKHSGNVYSRDELRLFQTLGRHASVAVENSRLIQVKEQQARELSSLHTLEREQRLFAEALQDAAAIVSSSLNFDEVMDHILEQLRRVIAGRTSNLMLIESDTARIVRWHGYEKSPIAEDITDFSIHISEYKSLGNMIETGHGIAIDDTHDNPNWTPRRGWEWLRSYVGAPILIDGTVVGFLNVDGEHPNQFDQKDVQRLEAFAYPVAAAIQNARYYEKVISALEEKEVLLKEIHHRVKNNLQVVISLLNLQIKQLPDRQVNNIFLDSQNRVRSMALVHDKLYHSETLSNINFSEYIEDLIDHIFQSYHIDSNLIQTKIEAEDVILDIDFAVPCGLILSELISNSLKYAFPNQQHGEIRVGLTCDQYDQVILMIADNGIGMPEGVEFGNSSTLGLQLVCTLTEQLNGDVELIPSDGTVFRVQFQI